MTTSARERRNAKATGIFSVVAPACLLVLGLDNTAARIVAVAWLIGGAALLALVAREA